MSAPSSTPTTLAFLAPAYVAASEPEAGADREPTDVAASGVEAEPPGKRLARALEAVNNTTGANPRIRVEIV